MKEKDSVAYDKKWRDYFKHEAEALQKKSEERKKLYEIKVISWNKKATTQHERSMH